jgi:hypothetical protein
MPFSEEFKLKVVLAGGVFGETHIPYALRRGESTLRPFRHGWENLAYLVRLRFETRAASVVDPGACAGTGSRVRRDRIARR